MTGTEVEPLLDHPAKFGSKLWPDLVGGVWPARQGLIVDPFAGVGGIHHLRTLDGFEGVQTIGIEIEPEWAATHEHTWHGDATRLPFPDESVDAICTSPAYGNRMSDQYLGEKQCPTCLGSGTEPGTQEFGEIRCERCGGSGEIESTKRYGYAISLGRKVSDGSSAGLPWGPDYRSLHRAAWTEAHRVLVKGGRMVINVKDHIRGGQRQMVSAWHAQFCIIDLGLELLWVADVDTGSLRNGQNHEARCVEQVWVFRKRKGML